MQGNGKTPGQAAPSQEQVAQANAILASIQPAIHMTVAITMRGLIASFPGVRPDAVMSMLCYEVGQAVGTMLQGDLVAILKIRKACQEALAEGVRKSPPPNVGAAPPPQPAPPNLRG